MRKATREFRVDGVGRLNLISTQITNVAGDLELGSAGREGAGQAHDQDLLAGAGLAHVQEDRRVELEAVLRVVTVSRRRVRAVSRLSSRASCLASAGRVRTTVSRFSALRCVTVAFGSCRSPRATAPRELCGDCYVGGTLLPAWTFTSGIASPAFTMAATERERFAAGGSVLLLLYGPRACHTQRAMSAI